VIIRREIKGFDGNFEELIGIMREFWLGMRKIGSAG